MPTAPKTSRITDATSIARCRMRASGRGERRLDARGEPPPVFGLVAVRLDRADLVQRLVHIGAHVADAILACPRELAHAASEQDDRNDDHRHARQHQQRELRARDREHREAAGEQQQVADRHRRAGTDDGLQHRRVVDEARNHVAGPRRLVESRRQRQQVVEHRAPQVGGDPLADPRHEVEARERRAGHHGDDAAASAPACDRARRASPVPNPRSTTPFKSLADREHRAGRDDERDGGEDAPASGTAGRTRRRARAFSAR